MQKQTKDKTQPGEGKAPSCNQIDACLDSLDGPLGGGCVASPGGETVRLPGCFFQWLQKFFKRKHQGSR